MMSLEDVEVVGGETEDTEDKERWMRTTHW